MPENDFRASSRAAPSRFKLPAARRKSSTLSPSVRVLAKVDRVLNATFSVRERLSSSLTASQEDCAEVVAIAPNITGLSATFLCRFEDTCLAANPKPEVALEPVKMADSNSAPTTPLDTEPTPATEPAAAENNQASATITAKDGKPSFIFPSSNKFKANSF